MCLNDYKESLKRHQSTWLVTGAAGFIGSHLVENLLNLGQRVIALDNFSTGKRRNLEQVRKTVGPECASYLRFIEGDVRNLETCQRVCEGVDYVLHQAALGSVPRSIELPLSSHESNVDGFVNILLAARDVRVKKFVYASSSSVYGDSPALPKRETDFGNPLSPYAVTKLTNELYAGVFGQHYDIQTIGLRYFNVFGPRQDPNGQYAAVIPRWLNALLSNEPCSINGDGETSRDFCYIENVVQANLLSALAVNPEANNQVYNIAVGGRTTLNQLYASLLKAVSEQTARDITTSPIYRDFRPGDIRHSLADIQQAEDLLGYCPTHKLDEGIELLVKDALNWQNAENLGEA